MLHPSSPARLLLPALAMAALFSAACSGMPVNPTGPAPASATGNTSQGTGAPQSSASKVDVCHRSGRGFHLINVSGNALQAHLAHGDGQPHGPVPGTTDRVFGAACDVLRKYTVAANAFPGVTVEVGQAAVVVAEGQWSVGGPYGTYDADGATTFHTEGCAAAPSAPMGALVGSLDGGVTWQLIGAGPTTISGPGSLLLRANDCAGPGGVYYGDNTGTLQVTIGTR